MSRRASETYPANKSSTIGGQIFTRGPVFTRDILEKMHKDRRQIMGYEIETKQLWVLSGLLLLFLLSLAGMIAMWFTESFDNMVFSNLALAPNSRSFEVWLKPAPKPLTKIYIFNYTNAAEFLQGDDETLNVKEVGPYIYEMSLERINPKFNDSKLTYQERKVYKFMPELSIGSKQNDRITVPNIPLLGAAAHTKHATFLARMGLSGLLNSLDAKPFITLPAHRFIMGYEDNLYSLSKSYMKLQNINPYDRFGLLFSTVGVSDDIITINTGQNDINKVCYFDTFNGETSLHHWSTDECNDLTSATDGSIFAPKLVRNKLPLNFYIKEMCRALPLRFEKEVKILGGKIPAYRYVVPDSVFDHPDRTPSNQCFCDLDLGECPPQGVFNATPCSFGAPIFTSFPHFYNADPKLKNAITGLNPKPDYQSYVDIHPTLGFTMAGKHRVQVNVQVNKAFGISQLNRFEDGLMLPIAWVEASLEDKTLPEDTVGIIFQTTFTLKSIELGLKYGFILTVGVTLFCILLVLKNRWTHRVRRNSSSSPLETNEERV